MIIAVWLSLVIGANSAPCGLKPANSVVTNIREIHVGDVVDLDCVDANDRSGIAAQTIAVLPAGESQIELARSAVKALVRRRVPGLDLPPQANDDGKLTLRGPVHSPQIAPVSCHRARSVIPVGKIVVASDLESTACERASPAGILTFDRRHHVARAVREIAPGEFVGRLSAPPTAYDAPELVNIVIAIGPVRIERTAQVVQPAIGGRDVFVRDSDGAIFAVPTQNDENGVK